MATSNSLLWNNLEPVFVDFDPEAVNLDPRNIEQAITPQTSAILQVHCYGFPCDLGRIGEIASSNGLKVIYYPAHAFGVMLDGESILKYVDASVLIFRATKFFNTSRAGQ